MTLLLKYLALCWFKNNPADLVPSKSFMFKVVIFYLVSGIIVESLIADFADGTLEVLLRTFMAYTSISLFLVSIKKLARFSQLYTAIFVCENFIMTLAIAAEILDVVMVRQQWTNCEEISIGIATVLVVWYIGIVSYIIRQLFAYQTVNSLIYAFSYFILTYGFPMLLMDI